MTNPERHLTRVAVYRLPANAGRLDRATLAFWRAWDGWIRPLLWTATLMIAAYVLIGQVSGVGGGSSGVSGLHYLVRWRRGPAASVSGTYPRGTLIVFGGSPSATRGASWAVGAAFVASIAAAAAARRVVRRNAHPERLAVVAALVVTLAHLWLARLFTLTPLRPAAVGWNVAAVVALWSLSAFAFVAARYPRRTQPAVTLSSGG